ncbi:MAG: sugar ABC transporter permease [Chloroflexi bacterium]|nr:sugar ABC transporter permease [Chloroflexota bacterium]
MQASLRGRVRRNAIAYVFVAPTLVTMLLVHFIPGAQGMYMSFLDLKQVNLLLYLRAPFIGLAHYQQILGVFFGSDDANVAALGQALNNTLWYTFWVDAGTLGLGLALALLLHRRFRGVGLARTLVLLPWVMPTFVVGIAWNLIWLQDGGLANHLLVDWLGVLHFRPAWLTGPASFWALVIPSIWRTLPFTSVMLLAGLQVIPTDLYEAARVDGATGLDRFRYITLPFLMPVLSVLVLFGTVFNLIGGQGYNISASMFAAGSGAAVNGGRFADLIVPAIVRQSFERQLFGYGAAASVVVMLILLVLVGVWYRGFRSAATTAD